MYGRNTRGLPGMLAPMYQVAAFGCRVALATCWTWSVQAAAAGPSASIVPAPCSRSQARQSPIHSTCCSIATGMLDSTDGLPGPVIVNRFGNPGTATPR